MQLKKLLQHQKDLSKKITEYNMEYERNLYEVKKIESEIKKQADTKKEQSTEEREASIALLEELIANNVQLTHAIQALEEEQKYLEQKVLSMK